jgi:DNA helicase-2/ATP-dependent DNA helicase PcrA
LDYALCDRVILYRTNAQSRSFEEAFIRAGIPYKLVGGVKFYARKEIKDVLAYLRLVVNPKDEVSRERVVKLGKRKYEVFRQWREDWRIKIDQDTEAAQPLNTLREILSTTDYQSRYDDHDPEDFARLENIQELLSVAGQFTTIDLFLENIALLQDNEMADVTLEGKADVVTMMSIHSAKGLEYPVVYLVGMEEGLFPHSRSIMDKEQMEEERRLCYVAITRAKAKLYLTYARRRLIYGSITSALPSRFLNDIPANLIKKEAAQGYSRLSNFGAQYGSGYGSAGYGSGSFNGAYGKPVVKQNKWHLDDQPEEPDQFGLRALNKKLDEMGRKQKYVPLDDASLDDVLSGEIDIEAFLEK